MTTNSLLWALPFPSSMGVKTSFKVGDGRLGQLYILDTSGENRNFKIEFVDVAQYRVYYKPELNAEMVNDSYDKLVVRDIELGYPVNWYMMTFDDGPTYVVRATKVLLP